MGSCQRFQSVIERTVGAEQIYVEQTTISASVYQVLYQ